MMPTLTRRLAAAVLTAAAVLSVSACSVTAKQADVESKVSELLKAEGVPVESVTCPGDLKGEVDASIKCTIVIPPAQNETVIVKVTSVDGTTVNFEVLPDTQ